MTRLTHIGEAIREERRQYGSNFGGKGNRKAISQADLYQKCLEATHGNEPFPTSSQPALIIREIEKGIKCPSPERRRIFEAVFGLDPHELDQYEARGQVERRARKRNTVAPAAIEALSAPPVEPRVGAIRTEVAAAAPPPSLAAADPLNDLGGVDTALAAGMFAASGDVNRFAEPYDSDRRDDDIKELRRALRATKRLTVVTGQPFVGKKAKIKGMLRLIAERNGSLTIDVAADDQPPTRMPIFAWSARRLHYRELVERVHDFLERYQDARHGRPTPPEPALPMPEQDRALDELIERINQNFKDLPAVFIFCDVDAFGSNYARNVVRDLGIEQLIRTLLDANKATRIIITTTDFESRSRTNRQFINFPQHQIVKIEEPHLGEVQNFIREDIRNEPALLPLYDCDVRLRGDDLVALAALISLTYNVTDASLPHEAEAAIGYFIESDAQGRDAAREVIYRQIADAILEAGLIYPVALAAASEDGVRTDSMRYLLHRWARQDVDVAEFPDDRAVDEALTLFAERVGTRFLRRTTIARYDDEEYGFGEAHSKDDRVWEMDPIISMYFLDALRTLDRTLPAYAHRLIALIARQRSQQKKVQMRSPIGSRASEEGSRDIQCYVNLLASIIFRDNDTLSLEGPPLRLAEREIFAIDDSFSAARALRFAVYCLLKEDIDHDHRLTMIFDEDALRLDLFLLLFQELGRVYTPEVEMLDLPPTLPDHLTTRIFTPGEILDLMSTIALSAYHAQRSSVVDEIVAMAKDLALEHDIDPSSIELSRLWCCKIDASMRRGFWVELSDDRTKDGNRIVSVAAEGHRATLKFVADHRRAWYPDLIDTVPSLPIAPQALNRHKAHLRLLIREADLATLVNKDRTAAAHLYGQVEATEAVLAALPDQHDPIVLSGRAGRRYIQFLLQDMNAVQLNIAPLAERDALLGTVGALLSVNKSRLRRFSGADRVGVMLDMARLKMVLGDLRGANHFAESAKRRAFSGSVSHGGKLDVFQVLAEVKLSLVEMDNVAFLPNGQVAADLLRDAGIAIRNLRAIAEHLDYAPSRGMAHLLEARLALVLDTRQRALSGPPTGKLLGDARKAVNAARRVLHAIHQLNLNGVLDRIDAELGRRRALPA